MKIKKKIGVFYPSAYPNNELLKNGLLNLQNCFNEVITWKEISTPFKYLARLPEEAFEEFIFFDKKDDIDFLISARGGAGVLFLVNNLLQNKINLNPKFPIVIGFSDLTSLFWFLYRKYKKISIYGPVVAHHFSNFDEWKTKNQFRNLVEGNTIINLNEFGTPQNKYSLNKTNSTPGIIIPACLSILSECVEKFESEEKFILILEDINEKAYKIERYMNLLEYKGLLQKTSAIILGNFLGVDKIEWVEDIFLNFCKKHNIELITGLNFGHNLNSPSIPFGVKGFINKDLLELNWENFIE